MLSTNNEINVKKAEKKYSWLTVFAWLYLETIGRIFPKKWNRWAENILYYNKSTTNNKAQTDSLKTADESTEIAEKESQSISQDEGIQTEMQTECIEKADKNIEADLKPEVAEKETSEDEGMYSEVNNVSTDEDCSDIEVGNKEINNRNELVWDDCCEVCIEDDEKLKEQLEGISLELEVDRLQNIFLEKENEELRSKNEELEREKSVVTIEKEQLKLQLTECEEDYTELKDVSEQIEKEFLAELEELRNETAVEMQKKNAKVNSLMRLNEALKQNIKEIETRSNEQQQIAEIYIKLNELLLNVTEISERTLQLHNQEQQEEKKSFESKVLELQKQAQILEGNKEWALAGIDGTLKETFLTITELLAQQLQEQSVKEKKLEELDFSYDDRERQIEELQLENDLLKVKNGELLSVIEQSIKEEAEVKKIDEKIRQDQYRLINQIIKLEEELKEKGTQYKEQLKESQRELDSLEHKLASLESQSATAKAQQRKDNFHLSQGNKGRSNKRLQETKKGLVGQERLIEQLQADIKKLQKEKENVEKQLEIMQQLLLNNQERQKVEEELEGVNERLGGVKEKTKKLQEQTKSHKAGAVSLDNKYNEKFVHPYTYSLPLEDKIKKQYTPNSPMTCISSIASIHSLNGQRAVRAGP